MWFPETLAPDSQLRWLQMTSTGVDNKLSSPVFDPPNGVVVTCAAGCHAVPIAEYCLFAMGLLVRGLLGFYRDQQQRVRDRSHSTLTDLWGQTVGIVGYGHIGREVARLAKSFNMRVLALKRHPERRQAVGFELTGVGDPDGSIPETIFGPQDLPALLAESDFVVSTVPMTTETAQIFDDDAFAAMRRGAYFINVSRGGVVDHDALVRALEQGTIRRRLPGRAAHGPSAAAPGASALVVRQRALDAARVRQPQLPLHPQSAGPVPHQPQAIHA